MGKRNNKNKNKKLLKNSSSEKKPGTSLEQDGERRRQSSPKPFLPENKIESSHKNFENSNNEIKKSNYQRSQRSDVMRSAGHAFTVAESKATNDYKSKNSKKDSSVLSESRVRSKQGKKITSNQNVNGSEFRLCEDLFSEGTFNYGSNDCDSYNSKDTLNPSYMKEKNIDQKDCRIKNNQNSKKDSSVLSENSIGSKQGKKITSNQNVNGSEFHLCEDLFSEDTFNSGSNDYNPYDCDSYNSKHTLNPSYMKEKHIDQKDSRIKNNQNSKKDPSVLSESGVRSKQGKKITSNRNVNESEFRLCEDLFSEDTFNSGSNDCNPYDCDFYNSKDIFNPSYMKERNIDQKDSRIKNNRKVVTSERNWSNANQKSENEKNKIKIKPNKQVLQNTEVTKFIPKQVLFQDKPILRNVSQYGSFESKNINGNQNSVAPNFSGARPKYKQNAICDIGVKELENCSLDKYSYKSDNDCKERRNSEQKLNSKQRTAKDTFVSSVNKYKHSKDTFSSIYHKWLPERKSSMEKLASLLDEVQDSQRKYNEVQATFKDCSATTRCVKMSSNSVLVGFLASAFTMACDATSGLSSFVEVFNTDCFQRKFQEIMDHDAEITKDLYESRSQCVTEYQGIEEVMKKFHCNTLSSTVSKISDTLEVGKYWEAMKKSYRNDDMASLMNIVGNFFNNACESEVLGKVCHSLETYVTDNPAALEGCKSAGKSMYEYVNVCAPIYNRKSIRGRLDNQINGHLMLKDIEEAEHLKNNFNKSKLELQIEDAIDLLSSELEEIEETYKTVFQSENQNS